LVEEAIAVAEITTVLSTEQVLSAPTGLRGPIAVAEITTVLSTEQELSAPKERGPIEFVNCFA
jgi:hypothetical protein